ncbi:MAG: ABC transporter ATP-binding protein [Pseudomonadota bacterium]|nr:ABC transporter ATP-binding protein [Pseudomonadota bacterium]
MARIDLHNVCVDYPVYDASSVSLKKRIASSVTGGRFGGAIGVTTIKALSNVTLSLRSGDRVGLVGHNGSGKTTLLRLLSGVYEPTAGRMHVQGHVTSLIDLLTGIEGDATGMENILLRGLVMGMDKGAIQALAGDIVDFSGLGDYIHLPVRTYSTGMVMRLAFSIVSCIRTDILLMDEWLAVGDADFSRKAESRLRAIVNDSGILVIASHFPQLILKECNKVIVMHHGVLQEVLSVGQYQQRMTDAYFASLQAQQTVQTPEPLPL